MAEERISLGPDSWTEGGMVDDVDVDVVEAKFCLYDYNGQFAEGPSLMMGLKIVGGDGDKVIAQYWSAGKVENFVPTNDGLGLKPVGKQTGLNKSCSLVILLESLLKKGFPKEKVDDIAKVIVGSRLHMVKVKQKSIKDAETGQEKDRNTLVVTNVIKWGWDGTKTAAPKAAAATKTKAPAAAAAAAPAEEAAEEAATEANPVAEKAGAAVKAVVKAAGGTMKRADLSTPVYKHLAKDADKSKAVKLAYDPAFLAGLDGIIYDTETEEIMVLD